MLWAIRSCCSWPNTSKKQIFACYSCCTDTARGSSFLALQFLLPVAEIWRGERKRTMEIPPSPVVNLVLPALPSDVQLENRFSALVADKGLGALPKIASELVAWATQEHWGKWQWWDSLLQGMEGPTCPPALLSREVSLLPGLRSGTLQGDCWGLSGSWTVTPWCFST